METHDSWMETHDSWIKSPTPRMIIDANYCEGPVFELAVELDTPDSMNYEKNSTIKSSFGLVNSEKTLKNDENTEKEHKLSGYHGI